MIKKYGEYTDLSIERLLNNEKLELETLKHYIMNPNIYDKNDQYFKLEEILSINSLIKKRISNVKYKKFGIEAINYEKR